MKASRSRLAPRLILAATVVAAVLASVLVVQRHAPAPLDRPGSLPSDLFPGPFPDGREVSFEEGVKAITYPLMTPDSPEANPATLTAVWVTDTDDIALVYGKDDITIMMWPWGSNNKDDAEAAMANVLANTTAKGFLVDIGGSPGVVFEPNTAANANPAWLEFVRDGLDINIYSSSESVDTLIAVAKTMTTQGGTPSGT